MADVAKITFVLIILGLILTFVGFVRLLFIPEIIGIAIIGFMYIIQLLNYFFKISGNIKSRIPEILLISAVRLGAIGFMGYNTFLINENCLYDSLENMKDFRKYFTTAFICKYVSTFTTRHHLAIRRKTNKKKTSVFHRLHKIQNYHFYCVFKLADSDISDTENKINDDSD